MTAPESSDSETEATSSTNQPAQDHLEQLERLIHIFFEALRRPCFHIKRIATYLMVERRGYEIIDVSIKWIVRNPVSSFALFIIGMILMPFLFIIGFGVGIIAVSLTGFIVLEGTLLTFVSILSFGCLGALVIVLALLAAIILSVYMGFAHVYDIYGSGKINALTDFLKREQNRNAERTHSRERSRTESGDHSNSPLDNIGSES